MGLLGIAAVIGALTLVVLAAVMIPTLLEIKKTAAVTRVFIQQAETDLKPLLGEFHEMLTDLREMTGSRDGASDVRTFVSAIGETGRYIQVINRAVGGVVAVIASSSLWMTGAKVAGGYLLDKIAKKRG